MAKSVARWRSRSGEPIVVDEVRYGGDIDRGWGNLVTAVP